MCAAYYNEWDPFAAQWLRNLISAGLIVPGDVDERSIEDVAPDDLRGYRQCHFFAGIGGWSYALRLAGWPDDCPVWTGSCPCPPFSVGGRKKKCLACQSANVASHVGRTGYYVCCQCQHEWLADSRHLWPEMWRLISAGRPRYFFGEQVAGSDGETWFAAVRASLEILGYDVRAASLNAAGVGAPHIRQRLYFVGECGPLGVHGGAGLEGHGRPVEINEAEGREAAQRHAAKAGVAGGTVAHVDRGGLEGAEAEEGQGQGQDALRCGAAGVGFWKDARWHWCPGDETYRPVEPGIFPLVDGLSKRVGRGCDPGAPFDANATAEGRKGRLIGYGNGIVAEVAAEFMRAFMQAAASRVPAIESSHAAGVHKFTEIASSR